MKKSLLFFLVLGFLIALLSYYSFVKKDSRHAIVAEVEPYKMAISFPKPVRITELPVQPGAFVKKGDLLLKVERPDLDLDIQKVLNEQQQLSEERNALRKERLASLEIEKLSYDKDQYLLDQRLLRLENEINRDNQIYSSLKSGESESSNPIHQDIQTLDVLREEKLLETKEYESKIKQIESRFASELLRLDLKNQRLESELEVLYIERENLTQLAPFSGTIGSISVQLNELVPPYETIISIYDESPNIIKAYMNERMRLTITPGDTVLVESINRQYKIQGDVIEVGSRIVSYPKQMIGMGQQNMWGREIFVRIPRENEFLNGEKVYVILDSF